MILYDTPLLMVLAFLGLTLVIGLCVSQKETTFREYAVGNRRFHTATLLATSLATFFGGVSLMHSVPIVYGYGMFYMGVLFGNALHHFIIPILGLRMGPFMEHLSVAETVGSIYGKHLRAIVAVLGVCSSIGLIAIEISVMSSTIGMCIDSIDPRIVTVLATLILIIYAMLGGARSITITDVLQFLTCTIIIVLLIKLLFIKTGKSFLEVVLLLKDEARFQLSNLFQPSWRKPFKLIQFYLWYAFGLSPMVIQRVYMSSGPIQVYKVFSYVTTCTVIILWCIHVNWSACFCNGSNTTERSNLAIHPSSYVTYL